MQWVHDMVEFGGYVIYYISSAYTDYKSDMTINFIFKYRQLQVYKHSRLPCAIM